MYEIRWVDRKGAGWLKRTPDASDAISTLKGLFKRHIEARCYKDGQVSAWGAVWKADWGWDYFYEKEAQA